MKEAELLYPGQDESVGGTCGIDWDGDNIDIDGII